MCEMALAEVPAPAQQALANSLLNLKRYNDLVRNLTLVNSTLARRLNKSKIALPLNAARGTLIDKRAIGNFRAPANRASLQDSSSSEYSSDSQVNVLLFASNPPLPTAF